MHGSNGDLDSGCWRTAMRSSITSRKDGVPRSATAFRRTSTLAPPPPPRMARSNSYHPALSGTPPLAGLRHSPFLEAATGLRPSTRPLPSPYNTAVRHSVVKAKKSVTLSPREGSPGSLLSSRASGGTRNEVGTVNQRFSMSSEFRLVTPRGESPEQKRKHRYVVGIMNHCGSIYEEMSRQLIATGRWTCVPIRQRSVVKTLYSPATKQDLTEMDVHLLLGEKLPSERVISTRRLLSHRVRRNSKGATYGGSGRCSEVASLVTYSSVRMPMGNGDDGEARVVDFVENTRCITLKSSMLATLLRHHRFNWSSLGKYLPLSFRLVPRQSTKDERDMLLSTCKGRGSTDPPLLWIAKSSSGSHGDNIEIFPGDAAGLSKLLQFVDKQSDLQPWVAQQYIDQPLLYHKRKFDLRCWVLLLRDGYEIFVHEELVMRMSSVVYDRATATSSAHEDRLAHITNHCVQSQGQSYSQFEEGNELWREHLDGLVRYRGEKMRAAKRRVARSCSLGTSHGDRDAGGRPATSKASSLRDNRGYSPSNDTAGGESITLRNTILPQIYDIVVDTLLAARTHVPEEPDPPPTHCFQVFGYDFIIDDTLKVWLLEINGAPGAAERIVPKLIADTIELAVTPFFPTSLATPSPQVNGYVRVYPFPVKG